MNKEFRQAIAVLNQTNEDFANGHTSSVAHANTRQAAILAAVRFMAKSFGVQLAPMHAIDANGEISIVALDGDRDPSLGCGRFGGPFAALLNTANPRTGVMPGATLCSESGWCRLNHFEAEKLVIGYASSAIR